MATTIHVTGDAYWAIFYMPRGRIFLEGLRADHAHAQSMPVGAEYIYRAIKAACSPQALLTGPIEPPPNVTLTRRQWRDISRPGEAPPPGEAPLPNKTPIALYEIANVGSMSMQDDATVQL